MKVLTFKNKEASLNLYIQFLHGSRLKEGRLPQFRHRSWAHLALIEDLLLHCHLIQHHHHHHPQAVGPTT